MAVVGVHGQGRERVTTSALREPGRRHCASATGGPLNERPSPADIYGMSDLPNNPSSQPRTFSISCRSCHSPLIQATDWARQDKAVWSARLWCPECWQERHVVLDREQAVIMSLVVEEGIACLLQDLVDLADLPTAEPGQRPGLRL